MKFNMEFLRERLIDQDGDSVADTCDTCTDLDALQTDSDLDGYGDACDTDYDQNTATTTADFLVYIACFTDPVTAHPDDPTCQETDHNGDGGVTTDDFVDYFLPDFESYTSSSISAVGPSGLPCADATLTDRSCVP